MIYIFVPAKSFHVGSINDTFSLPNMREMFDMKNIYLFRQIRDVYMCMTTGNCAILYFNVSTNLPEQIYVYHDDPLYLSFIYKTLIIVMCLSLICNRFRFYIFVQANSQRIKMLCDVISTTFAIFVFNMKNIYLFRHIQMFISVIFIHQ